MSGGRYWPRPGLSGKRRGNYGRKGCPMSKLVKIFLGLSAFVVTLLIALIILAKMFVTPERVKSVVLPLAEQALHRSITLGEVKVGLFSGIELHDLAVGEPGGGEPFVAADRVLLRFQWLPLLAKRVVIDEVALERPLIRLIRHADGSFNISDLLAPKPATGDSSAKTFEDKGGEPLSVLVTVAKIHGGRVVFVDQQVAATTELTELELDASGISRDGTVPVKLSARLQGAPLRIDGAVRPLQKSGKVGIDLQGLDVLAFEPYFRGKVPGKLSRLLLDLKGEFDLQGRAIAAKGHLSGRELNLFLLALPTAPLQNARVDADYDASLDLERDRLDVAALTVAFNGLAAQLSGGIADLTATPNGDLKLTVPDLDLAMLKGALPPQLLGKAGELELSGRLRASAGLNGPLSQPLRMLRSGEVTLDKLEATVAGVRPAVDGRITLAGEVARIETMKVRLGEVAVDVAGRIDKPFAAPVADITVNLPRIDLGKALATAPKESLKILASLAPTGQMSARATLVGPLARPAGLLKSAEATLVDVQVTAGGQRPEFAGRLVLTGDQLVSEGLAVRLGGNVAQLKVTARNLFGKPMGVTADVTAQRFQMEPLLQGGGAAAT
ncbi:MAG: DUF748 domain-containing protein, partial [Desulfuromonas sp.]|nr:DUF748 domain-containing protein [Desulfuromonas sp.]